VDLQVVGVFGMILKASCIVSWVMPPEIDCHCATPETGTMESWPPGRR
jgi:hypothetical protein